QAFQTYRDRLNAFFTLLRSTINQQPTGAAAALPRLQQQDAPPPASARVGFGVLPRIVDTPPPAVPPVSVFSYSWPITDGYITGENIKLGQAEAAFQTLSEVSDDVRTTRLANLILEYRKLLTNQRTIDQYIQYNQFWQKSIAADRARFDQLTKVY